MKKSQTILSFSSAAACCSFSLLPLAAQTNLDWRTEATDGNWNTTANWWNGLAPESPPGAEILRFNNNNQVAMTNDAVNTTRHRIIFEAGATTVRTIGGMVSNAFVAAGGNAPLIQNNSTAAHILNFPLSVGTDGLTVDTVTGALNLNGLISGSGTITKTTGANDGNAGLPQNLVVSGNNTAFTGKWVVTGGNLSINNDAALGAVPAAPVADAITLNGGSLANMSNANGTSFSNGHTLTLHANRGITLGANGGNIRIGYGQTVTINGAITGAGRLARSDGGVLVLNNAANNYAGITFLRVGTTRAGVSGALPATTNTLLYGTAILDLNGTTQSLAGVHVGSSTDTGAVLQLGTGGNLSVTGNAMPAGSPTNAGALFYGKISGTGSINYQHATNALGNWDWLNTANDFTGTVTVSNGRLRAMDNNLGNAANDITFNGAIVGTLANAQGTASLQQTSGVAVTYGAGRTFTLNSGREGTFYTWGGQIMTINGQVTGGGNLRKEDGGILLLNNTTNNYTGLTRVASGNIQLGAAGVLPDATEVEMAAGTIATGAFDETVASLFGTGGTISGGGTFTVLTSGNRDFAGSISATTLRMAGAGTQTLSGTGDNGSGRAIVESGTLILAKTVNAASRAVGQSNGATALTINGGTAQLAGNNGDQIFLSSGVAMTGGVLDFNGRNEAFRGLSGAAGIVRNTAASTTSTITLGESGVLSGTTAFSFGGVIENGAGTMAVEKTGSTTQTLAGVNTYTGSTTVSGGSLILSGTGSINTTASLTIGVGALVQLGAADRINNAAAINLSGGTLNTGGFNESVGILTLTGDNVLDLGAGASVVNFADSSSAVWASSLSILNWSGSLTGGGTDRVFFGNSATGLTPGQVGNVSFLNPAGFSPGTYGSMLLGNGEMVPVPEPGVLAMASLAAVAALSRRRRSAGHAA